MKPIDADALLKQINKESEGRLADIRNHYEVGYHNGLQMAKAMVISAPIIDIQLVVRCKDCKWCEWFYKNEYHFGECQRTSYHFDVGYLDFCSNGERKEV